MKYLPLVFYMVLLLLLPVNWYQNVGVDPVTFQIQGKNGLQIFMADKGRIGFIYLLGFLLQIYSLDSKKVWGAVLSILIQICVLLSFPLAKETAVYVLGQGILHTYYDIGLYLSVFFLIVSLGFHIFSRKSGGKNKIS